MPSQRELVEGGEQALQKSLTMPVNQAVEFQRNVAEVFLTGLEMQDRAQRQWIDMMKTTFDNYLNTMESAAGNVSQATQAGVQSAMEPGQGSQAQVPGAAGTGGYQRQESRIPPTNQQQPTVGQAHQGGQVSQGLQQPQHQGQGVQSYDHHQGQGIQSYGQSQIGQGIQGSQGVQGGQGLHADQQRLSNYEGTQQSRIADEPQEYERFQEQPIEPR